MMKPLGKNSSELVVMDNNNENNMSTNFHPDDLDQDGKVTRNELEARSKLERSTAQMKIAIAALTAMVTTMAVLLTPLISDERIRSLSSVFDMYFLACASIVGAYMGFSAWMTKR